MRNLVILLFISLFRAMCQDANGNPVILHTSLTASAGDLIYIQGSGFGSAPKVQYSFNDSNWVTVKVQTSGSQTAMVQLPASLGRLPDLLTVRVSSDGSRWSSPAFINRASAMSIDTDQISAGGRFRIFGRNLLFSRTPIVRLLDRTNSTAHAATVDLGHSTSYALSVIAPKDVQAGHPYNVQVSNGYNGDSANGGYTSAGSILVGRSGTYDYWNLGVPWSADLNYTGNIYNVKTDPRLGTLARGDGSAGDLNVIRNAIWRASNDGGGIVYLPAGTYNLYYPNACGLTLLPRVALVGAGMSNTFVNYGFGAAPVPSMGGWAVCFGNHQSGVSDITFTNVNESGHWPQSATALKGNEVFMQRTRWNIASSQWLVFQELTHATVQNSTITQGVDPSYNGPLSLLGSNYFLLKNNTVKYVAGSLLFNAVSNGVLENNTIIRDASKRVPDFVITHVIIANFANNFSLLNNTFKVTGGTLPLKNDGETIGTEGGGAVRYDEFRGTVQSAGTNFIYDGGQNFNWSSNNAIPNLHAGAEIAIVSGKGFGQWATITSVSGDGHTVWIDKPWVVVPTAGCHYATFDWSAANWIIAGNNLSDNEKGIEFFDSSIRDVLITGNTMVNNSEILISPTEQPVGAGLFNVVLNTQILNNTLIDNNNLRPAAISAVSREDFQNTNFGTSIIGLELRGNSITGHNPNTVIRQTYMDDSKALTEGFNIYWQWQTLWSNYVDQGIPSILGTILQGNSLTNSTYGLVANSGLSQTALANNTYTSVGSARVDFTVPGSTHSSVGTITVANPVVGSGTPVSHATTQVTVLATNSWITQGISNSGAVILASKTSGGIPALGDYDGDGLVDPVVFIGGNFHVQLSSNKQVIFTYYFGQTGDIPVPGDYDGDGKTDYAIFRPGSGTLYYASSSKQGNPVTAVQTQALNGDIPAPGDYDGDGKTDIVFFRPSDGTYHVMLSTSIGSTYVVYFSNAGDIPAPGDYDGDGKTDLAVFRPSTGTWYYRHSTTQQMASQTTEGRYGDIPVPGDYDSDGKTDFVFWRPNTQTWYINLSSKPGSTVTTQFGNSSSSSLTPVSGTPNSKAAKVNLTIH